MKAFYSLLFISVLAIGNAFSQCDYRGKFTEGNFLILEENYSQALKNFKEAYQCDSSSANINYKLGFCYLKSADEKYKALPYLEKAVKNVSKNYADFEPREKKAPVNAYYYLAMSYHLNYKFDDALANFEKYKSYLNQKKQPELYKDVEYRMEQARTAKMYVSVPMPVNITNMGDSINSPYPEYSAVISADESMMIFTSRRPDAGAEKAIDDQYYEDVYITYKKNDGTWTKPLSIDPKINTTSDHEAVIGLSADGQTLFVYKDENGDGGIYESHIEGEGWSSLMKVGSDNNSDINTKSWEPSACITADGKTIYFVSDRKGGFGGRDLYRAVKLPNGKWSMAKNLGPQVNTAYDEDAPFIHPDQKTLFFSSKGHKGMGGFDIYFTSVNDSGWSQPVNMGYPINTPDDDIFYVTSTDGKRAYYASTREGGLGEKDIYMITLQQPPKVDPVALIVGYLVPGTGEPCPADNEILVTNVQTGEVRPYRASSRNCKFTLVLTPGEEYSISYLVNGQEVKSENISVPSGIEYEEISKTIYIHGEPTDTTKKTDPVVINDPGKDPKTDPKNVKVKEKLNITGTFNGPDSSPSAGLKLSLKDAGGKVLGTTNTDNKGSFSFKDLTPNKNYTINVDAVEGEFTHSLTASGTNGENIPLEASGTKYTMNSGKNSITIKGKKPKTDPVVNDPIVSDPVKTVNKLNLQGTFSNSDSSPVAGVKVTLKDASGKVLGTTNTDDKGAYSFNDLGLKKNYTISVDAIEGQFTHSLTASNTSGENIALEASGAKYTMNSGKNSITIKGKKPKTDPVATNNDPSQDDKNKLATFTGKQFEMSFKYNIAEIDVQNESFIKFIDMLVATINDKGSIELQVTGSASTVPTRKFGSNKELAQSRAENGKQKVEEALKSKGVDISKVKFSKVKGSVNGPAYNGDYDLNKATYEKHQYVRIDLYTK
jgi:tetratricopeptide (TPR) repeat protein